MDIGGNDVTVAADPLQIAQSHQGLGTAALLFADPEFLAVAVGVAKKTDLVLAQDKAVAKATEHGLCLNLGYNDRAGGEPLRPEF